MRRRLTLLLGFTLLVLGAWVWFGPLADWRAIERIPFDPASAREVLATTEATLLADNRRQVDGPATQLRADAAARRADAESAQHETPLLDEDTSSTPTTSATTQPTKGSLHAGAHDVFLILGSDEKPDTDRPRADTIMLLIVPEDRSSSMLVSLPRGLYVTSPCTNQPAPINTNLEGCGVVSGFDLMGVAVEDYTGLEIDHLVLFNLNGFRNIIDRIGGIEVCVEHPIKLRAEQRTFLEPGCSQLDGRQALRWVQSRQTLENIEGEWQLMEGAGDFLRTRRQRDMVRQVIGKADQFDSPTALATLLSDLADFFTLDEGLSLSEALDLAWELRVLGRRPVLDLTVDATGAVTPNGQFVLIPDQPFSEYLTKLSVDR